MRKLVFSDNLSRCDPFWCAFGAPVPYIAFSQEKVIDNIDARNFATIISKVNAVIADFGDKLKRTKIGDMSEALVSGPLKTVTLDQYVKYGIKTNEGTVIYTEKGVAVPPKTADNMVYVIKAEDEAKITKYLLGKFNDFYKEIAPVLTDICKNLKNSPVRLDGVNIEMAPFGIGGSITIGINYDSSIFGKEK